MARHCQFIVEHARTPGSDHELNKALADFDFDSQRRLGRTRMLVRAGPALGLMGTLIPLSPALTGLANGNTAALSHEPARRLQRHGRRAADRRRRVSRSRSRATACTARTSPTSSTWPPSSRSDAAPAESRPGAGSQAHRTAPQPRRAGATDRAGSPAPTQGTTT